MTTRSLAQVEVEILVLQDQLAQLKVEASSLRLGGRLPRALETGLPMELEEYVSTLVLPSTHPMLTLILSSRDATVDR